MAIRRSDTRRRRVGVLIDEHPVAPVPAPKSKRSSPSKKSETNEEVSTSEYSISARRRHLAKTTDLIPKRFWPVSILILGITVAITVLNILHRHTGELVEVFGERASVVFSLHHPDGLTQWFCTTLLLIGGLASFQIYALRRHRSNDYIGTYALWLWVGVGLLMSSVSLAIGLPELARNAIQFLAGIELLGGSMLLVAIETIFVVVVGARLLVEVRQSRIATTGVAAAGIVFLGASLIDLDSIRTQVGDSYEVAAGNLMLIGNSILLLTIFGYARFVYLRAQGILSEEAAALRAEAKLLVKEQRAQAKADKFAAKEQAKADKLAAIEQAKADKIAAKEQAIAEKEQAKADRIREAEEAKAEKQLAKEQAKAEKLRAKEERKLAKQTASVTSEESSEGDTEDVADSRERKPAPLELKLQTRKSQSKKKSSKAKSKEMSSSQESDADSLVAQSPLGGKLSKRKQKKLRKQQQEQQRRAA